MQATKREVDRSRLLRETDAVQLETDAQTEKFADREDHVTGTLIRIA